MATKKRGAHQMTQRERDLLLAEKRWAREKPLKEREDKRDFRAKHSKKLSTSKLLILFLFINCTLIEIFTGFVTLKSLDLATMTMLVPDFTPLVTLIGAVVSEVIGFAIYAIKSAKENTMGGIIYETAMAELHTPDRKEEPTTENSSDSVG